MEAVGGLALKLALEKKEKEGPFGFNKQSGESNEEESLIYPGKMLGELAIALEKLGWDYGDDVAVEIAGSSVYMIDGAVQKWAPKKGTVKYNKDAFIVIKNKSRNPTIPSVNDDPERLPHHSKMEASEQQSDSGKSSDEHSGAIDGRWYRTETLDYTGKRTRRYIIESDITEEPDSSESDVSGSDSSDT